MRLRLLSHAALALLVTAAGCGDDGGSNPPIDGRRADAATTDGAVPTDAAEIDATPIDAPPPIDAPVDAIPTPTERIALARAAADGTGLSLPIVGATVTYLKPALGTPASDPAGFTVQIVQTGPALFIAVDPSTLTPPPIVGDVVSFTITTMATVSGQRRATAVTGFTRDSQGANVTALAQNLTAAADVVTAIESYDSELVTLTATVAGDFVGASAMFESAPINTTGLTGNTSYRLRLPATLKTSLELGNGCTFTATNVPISRFGATAPQAQVGVYVAGDIAVTSCPAPTVVSAVALSATSLQVTFSRNVLASTLLADGSQFTISNLTVTAAAISATDARLVTVTTSAQVASTPYTVTVANTVQDTRMTPIAAPGTATFSGFTDQAIVRINEINAHIQTAETVNVCDLIELRVTAGGSMNGFYLRERNAGTLVTFAGLSVATNDLIVVHMNTANTMCNPGGTGTQETTGPAQQPVATFTRNYDTAYDWYSTDTGITDTDNVITLYNGANVILDAVFVANAAAGTAAAATEAQAAIVRTANQWQMVGGGHPLTGYVDDLFREHAVLDLDATGTTAAGESIRRVDNSDDNDKADWLQGASTFGLINAGQTAL